MKPLKIIVVDNENVIRDACNLVLTERGHTVDLFKTGGNGLFALNRDQYDLALLDIKLPDMDGMDILKTIKERKPNIQVIVMTGYSTISKAAQIKKLGAADYLSKPFTEDELVEAIGKVFSEASSKQ